MTKKIAVSGVIGLDVTARDIRDQLAAANGGPVEATISSPGGYIGAGLEIFNLFNNYPGETTCVLVGFAMSMASYIPLAFDTIKAQDNAVYMIHNARGGISGDHNEILDYGAFCKGLSGLLAKAYAKRTGGPLKDIIAMMDKETFFFGDEMLDSGFVDEIIPTGKDKDQESAVASARATYQEAYAKWSADSPEARKDIAQAAAYMPVALAQPPAALAAGNQTQEVQQMAKLQDLLAANPEAQAEHNAAIQAAEARGKDAGEKDMQTRVTAAGPYLSSDSKYPQAVKDIAVKAISGEVPISALTTVVAAVDAVAQQQAVNGAQGDQAQQQVVNSQSDAVQAGRADITNVTDQAGLDALVAMHKGGK